MFEPSAPAGSPSGLTDSPRPFVFRAVHLDGCTITQGKEFFFDLNLFDTRSPAIAYLILAFSQFARAGVGPQRGPAELIEVSRLKENGHPAARIYDGTSVLNRAIEPTQLCLRPGADRVTQVRIRFVTPTELKCGHDLAARPEFGVLASRVRDRLSTLRDLYGDGPLDMDFRAFGERASRVRLTRCSIRQVDVVRRSSRTGQIHPIGGFVGEAAYEGDLTEFIPFLRAARWTGVGRQTVWGKGEIDLVSVA